MVEPLTPDRFRMLADAYGGVVARWPAADRDAAMRMAGQPFAAAILADALALDATLDGWRVPPPSRDLADRVAAMGPARRGDPVRRLRLWWSALGAAATLAGAAAGAAAVVVAAPVEHGSGTGTSFGDVSGQEG